MCFREPHGSRGKGAWRAESSSTTMHLGYNYPSNNPVAEFLLLFPPRREIPFFPFTYFDEAGNPKVRARPDSILFFDFFEVRFFREFLPTLYF